MSDTVDERKEYMKDMDEFFKNLKRCDRPDHPHVNGKCCYIGLIDERLTKYKEIRDKRRNKLNLLG
jgi:hypothetical protein